MIFPKSQDGHGHEPDSFGDQVYLDALNNHLAKEQERYNNTPHPDMGGLSPKQVASLLYSEWGNPDSVMQFNPDVDAASLERSPIFNRVRYMLRSINDQGGVKATAKKNLTRKFVEESLAQVCRPEELEMIHQYYKVINEEDVQSLHTARVVCEVAELLRIYKGKFIVPQKMRPILEADQVNPLFQRLFVAYFRKFNTAYQYRGGTEAGSVQMARGYSMYRLGKIAADWCSPIGLAEQILLPAVRDEVQEEQNVLTYETMDDVIFSFILRPMIDWGFLDAEFDEDGMSYFYRGLLRFRISSLYQSFFRFKLP